MIVITKRTKITSHDWAMVWWDFYYGIQARWGWICHRFWYPPHKMRWKAGCSCQCMLCETCDIAFWTHKSDWSNAIGKLLCAYVLGHVEGTREGWKRPSGEYLEDGEPIWIPIPPEEVKPYCDRCGVDL